MSKEGLPRRCTTDNTVCRCDDVRDCCCNCKHLYVKDFIYGICENARGPVGIRKPNDVCEYWEQDKEDGDDA